MEYEANPIPWKAANFSAGFYASVNYVPGAYDGMLALATTIATAVEDCGHTGQKIVVAGYSQGAWVAHMGLDFLARTAPALAERVVAIALLSDPLRAPYSMVPYGVSGASESSQGVASTKFAYMALKDYENYFNLLKFSFPGFFPEDFGALKVSDSGYAPELAMKSVQNCAVLDIVCGFEFEQIDQLLANLDQHGSYDGADHVLLGYRMAEMAQW
ncbi:cutinase family protein [Pseudoclavibacter helvolus]|uniref:cutinase family protein n=1 Tax=Pseudoclavibacter helvolus TaxID=255205 RepID=UPI0037365A45